MSTISENIKNIKNEINSEITKLIAVSKYVGVQEVIKAYEAGVRDFAESKVKDAKDKRDSLPKEMEQDITWHFIGHLQTNKAKKVVGQYEVIHSIDSLRLADEVNTQAAKKELVQDILLQVNITNEETKYGFQTNEIKEVFKKVNQLNNLNVIGLMTMAEHTDSEADLRKTFKELRQIKEELETNNNCKLSELSMGMSNDYKIATDEGSTMIRVGSKIFK